MSRLIMIGGPSGVGKTTLGEMLVDSWEDAIGPISADDFFTSYETGRMVYRFDPALLSKAHEDCQTRVLMAMNNRVPLVVVANTFTQKWERDPYYALAQQHGYDVSLIMMEMPLETDQMLAARNVHGVNAETIHKMRNKIAKEKGS